VDGSSHRHDHKRDSKQYHKKAKGDFRATMVQTEIEKQEVLSNESKETVNNSKDKNFGTSAHLNERLPTIKCDCGEEILLLPDLQAMNNAIKNHAFEHFKEVRIDKNKSAIDNISDILSRRVIEKIGEQNQK
jgi:hypothetical protein